MSTATFKTISVILWWSVLLVGETGEPRENYRLSASDWQTWSHNDVHPTWAGFQLTTLVAIGTGYPGSCKSNYDTITTMITPT